MDRRDHFVLQLALIVATVLVCLLAVTAYVYFDKFTAQQRAQQKLQAKLAEMQSAQVHADDEIARLRALLTAEEVATLEEIEAGHARDVARVAPSDSDLVRPTYQRLVGHMMTAVNDAVTREARIRADLLQTRNYISREREVHQKELAIVHSKVGEAEAELATQRANYQADRRRMVQQLDQLVLNIQRKAQEVATGKIELSTVKANLEQQLLKLDHQYQLVRDQWEATQIDRFEHPDGKITFADAGERIVRINLGRADLLRRGTAFNVYEEGTADLTSQHRKGWIEVTKILGDHQAEARIVEDQVSDPILSRDLVHTPLWQAGQRRRFAIAGKIDVDDDGRDDRQILAALITSNGGSIDCQVDHGGRRTGSLSVETRYVVMGRRPTEIDRKEGDVAAYDALLSEAKQLGIDLISVEKVFAIGGSHTAKMVRQQEESPSLFRTRKPLVSGSAY